MNLLNRLRPNKDDSTAPATPDAQAAADQAVAPDEASGSGATADPDGASGAQGTAQAAGALPAEGPVAELLTTIDSLEEVLAREMELLSENDPEAMGQVQDRKAQLAAAYETRVKGLTSDPTPLYALDEAARTALRERMTTFDRTMRANARTINAARAVTEDLLRTTVEIVKEHRRENGGYAPNGTRREEAARLSEPLNIDRNL